VRDFSSEGDGVVERLRDIVEDALFDIVLDRDKDFVTLGDGESVKESDAVTSPVRECDTDLDVDID